ncbi:MAG TPA: hypothetical protein VFE10_10115 [Phenylobacterium sp.]|jgi:hypothetical protein|nr:hypothetical protein [Phenylobacterium sp.]
MLKRLRLLVLPLLILTGSAHAAEKAKEVGLYVDLQPVAMPIVIDGQLVNYVFVYVRVNLRTGADIVKSRDLEPSFRDALVRDGHRTPFVLANDWSKVDEARLVSVMTRDAVAIAGPGVVASVIITSQIPQKRVMPPRPSPPDHP